MEAIKIEGLSFAYPNEEKNALESISLSIQKGEFFVLCGYSGSGKSTLLRHLKPSLTPHGRKTGSVYFNGLNIEELTDTVIASKIGYVMQSPESQLVTDKVWHELSFGLESLGLDNKAISRRSAEMAAFFGIEDWYYKNVSELSGGQKQLLCLASIMAMQPELLILDEPTAMLDPIAASDFLATLHKINKEFGTTIILSEHRLEDALSMADRCAVMDEGQILKVGTVREVGAYLKETKNNMLLAMPASMQVWNGVLSSLECPVTVKEGRDFVHKYIEENGVNEAFTKELASRDSHIEDRENNKARVSLKEVFFSYDKELPDIIKGLDLEAYSGELFCILGGNGAGKTTALKLISGIEKPYRGEARVDGTVGLLSQEPKAMFVKKTVYEDLSDVLKSQGAKGEELDEKLTAVSDLCRITKLLNRHPFDLSGGEEERVALSKVLLLNPQVLLLDEPTKGLDASFKDELADILCKLKNSGVCIIMVSHDIEFCAKYADRCALSFDGRLVSVGTPGEFFLENTFYTTAASRIARDINPKVFLTEDLIGMLGGEVEKRVQTTECAPSLAVSRPVNKEKELPLWRRLGASIFGLLSLVLFIYAAKTENLKEFIGKGGMTESGKNQLVLYGIFIALLVATALFLGGGKKKEAYQVPVEKRKIAKRTLFATVMILLLIPVTLFIGVVYLEKKQYYITALFVLIECMLPFFLIFEGRKPKARELVTIATLCALTIAGRAAFFMLPQFKPVLAMTIIAGVAFGGESGFLVGAVTMLVSNIMFSQGPWTPWQMFAMGIIGFLAGVFYRKGLLRRSRSSLCVFGAITAFVIYGGIMNPTSALMWGGDSLNMKIILSYYVTGFPMDAIHAIATVLFLWFGAEPMLEKLDRIKEKYGLLE